MDTWLIIIWVALLSYITGTLTALIISSALEEKRRKRLRLKRNKPTKDEIEDIARANNIDVREIE